MATAVLFTTLSGLGSIIMVGSIVLPILISVGVPAASAACIFLMAFTTGLACNIANWKSFASIFSLDIADIQGFEIYLMAATAIATLIMVIVEFKRNGIKFAFSAPVDNTKPTKQLTGVRGGLAMITPLIPIVLVAFPESACHACIHRWHHLVPAFHLAELQQGHEPDDQDLLRWHHRMQAPPLS